MLKGRRRGGQRERGVDGSHLAASSRALATKTCTLQLQHFGRVYIYHMGGVRAPNYILVLD